MDHLAAVELAVSEAGGVDPVELRLVRQGLGVHLPQQLVDSVEVGANLRVMKSGTDKT